MGALFDQPTLVVRHYLLRSKLILFNYNVMRYSNRCCESKPPRRSDPLCDGMIWEGLIEGLPWNRSVGRRQAGRWPRRYRWKYLQHLFTTDRKPSTLQDEESFKSD